VTARVAIGIPTFERAPYIGGALTSLLAQTYRDVAFVVVDDASTDATAAIAEEHAKGDDRLTVQRGARHIGMIENWRRAYHLALERAPGADYFAWASDHDLWHPRWLERLVDALDANPHAVLAYARDERIDAEGRVFRGPQEDFSTAGIAAPRRRLARALLDMRAGSLVYGLMRADAVAAAGVFPAVLAPDRALLLELALLGEFVEVEETLWQRRFAGAARTRPRQRRTLFPDRPPASASLPTWLVHASLLARRRGLAAGTLSAVLGPVRAARMRYRASRRLGRIGVRRVRAGAGAARRRLRG
jgi:glycosyltransferase involved in cell wall biosynthesis